MFLLTKPSEAFIQNFLEARAEDVFSCREVGASKTGVAPREYNFDYRRFKLALVEKILKKLGLLLKIGKCLECRGGDYARQML